MRVYGRTFVGCVAVVAVVALAGWQAGGCAGGLTNLIPEIPVTFGLGGGLGSFQAQAGTAAQNTGSGSFDNQGYEVGRGSLELDPSVITVTPADGTGGKGAVNLQQTSVLTVTVWIASADELEAVCDTGEQYGPFEVTLDENYVAIAVDPSSVTLSQNTIDLLNAGAFSLCIEVISPIDATVTIGNLTFKLGA